MKSVCRRIINRCTGSEDLNMDPLPRMQINVEVTRNFLKSILPIANEEVTTTKTLQANLQLSTTQTAATTVKSVDRVLKTLFRWPRLCPLRARQEAIVWFSSHTQIRNNCRASRIKGRITMSQFLPTRWTGSITSRGVWLSQGATPEGHSCTQSKTCQGSAQP